MAACGNFDKMIGYKLLCNQLAKVADNSTDKEFFKVYSAIGKLLNYEGLRMFTFYNRRGFLG